MAKLTLMGSCSSSPGAVHAEPEGQRLQEKAKQRQEQKEKERLSRLEDPAFQQQLQALLQDPSLGPIAKAAAKAFHPIVSNLATLKEASGRADESFARFFPLTDQKVDTDYGSFADDPVACAKDVQGNFPTIVLASVEAPCWWHAYVMSFVQYMVKSVAVSNSIKLLAVKGGPFSDAEVQFILELLPLVGAVPVAGKQAQERKGGKERTWEWEITRPGASTCKVMLVQYQEASDATDLAAMFRPSREHASTPVRMMI